jgi:hypothetical protein
MTEELNEGVIHYIHRNIIAVYIPETNLQSIPIEPLIQYLLIPGLLLFATFN